jgi:hypothetical protein
VGGVNLLLSATCAEGALQEPLLYLSLYFKHNRQAYYELLQDVRSKGNWLGWLGWLRFFLEGVRDTAQQALDTAKAILALFDKDRQKIETLGRQAETVHRVHQFLQRKPILSTPLAAASLKVSAPTAVSTTPSVARAMPGPMTGRIILEWGRIRTCDPAVMGSTGHSQTPAPCEISHRGALLARSDLRNAKTIWVMPIVPPP